MSRLDTLQAALEAALGARDRSSSVRDRGEITRHRRCGRLPRRWRRLLRDHPTLQFEQLIDLCGVDYSGYKDQPWEGPRYCVVSHLLSVTHNWRVRLKVFCARRRHAGGGLGDARSGARPTGSSARPSTCTASSSTATSTCAASSPTTASSATRSARTSRPRAMSRCATTPSSKRVIYQPVTIEPREITPRVVREDNYGGLH